MDGLDCTKCQKSRKKGTYMELMESLMRIRQNLKSYFLQNWRINGQWTFSRLVFHFQRERESFFSLDFWPFRLSILDRERSKVDLRGEGYTWTPIWWSSDNSKR